MIHIVSLAHIHSLSPLTLRYTRVELLRFVHLNGVVFEIEIDCAAPHTKLFLSPLVNCLLEVAVEPQHLQTHRERVRERERVSK